jgi:hypothetical protein
VIYVAPTRNISCFDDQAAVLACAFVALRSQHMLCMFCALGSCLVVATTANVSAAAAAAAAATAAAAAAAAGVASTSGTGSATECSGGRGHDNKRFDATSDALYTNEVPL